MRIVWQVTRKASIVPGPPEWYLTGEITGGAEVAAFAVLRLAECLNRAIDDMEEMKEKPCLFVDVSIVDFPRGDDQFPAMNSKEERQADARKMMQSLTTSVGPGQTQMTGKSKRRQ